MALCLHNPATGRELEHAARHRQGRRSRRRSSSSAPARPVSRPRASPASAAMTVIVFEAANDPGGQMRLTAQSAAAARDDLASSTGASRECDALGVDLPLQQLRRGRHGARGQAGRRHRSPPAACRTPRCWSAGDELVVSTWDILSGDVRAGLERADLRRRRRPCRAAGGGEDRRSRREGRDHDPRPQLRARGHGDERSSPTMRALQKHDVTFTVTWRLDAVHRDGNELRATHRQRLRRRDPRAAGRPGGRQPRHPAARRPLLRAPPRRDQPRRGRLRRRWSTAGRRRSTAIPRALTSSSASATPSPRATPTPRSTTPCAWSRTSDRYAAP